LQPWGVVVVAAGVVQGVAQAPKSWKSCPASHALQAIERLSHRAVQNELMKFATPSWHSVLTAATRSVRDGEVPSIRQAPEQLPRARHDAPAGLEAA